MTDRQGGGVKERTRLAGALDRLGELVDPIDRTERVPVTSAVGRVLADDVRARRAVPHFDRAATDGYAVRATETFEATTDTPVGLAPDERVDHGTTVRVDAGDELPPGADAVVRREDASRRDDRVEVPIAVAPGDGVSTTGSDVESGATVLPAGRHLRRSDVGRCRAVGASRVEVRERPTVGVVPTGDELVEGDPNTGEIAETSGLTVASLVEGWGGKPAYRNPVEDDRHAVRAALERDLTKDLVVTTGGTGAGDDDVVPGVVDDLGDLLVHGIALDPGRSAGFGVVRETPVLVLPGDPTAAYVTAVQLVRPAVTRAGHRPLVGPPTTEARLDGKVPSEVGIRTVAGVTVDAEEAGEETGDRATKLTGDRAPASAVPVGVTTPDALSGVAAADGWVVVPESREGVPAGETVTVEDWEFQP